MALKQCKKFKCFVREKIGPCKKEPAEGNQNKEEGDEKPRKDKGDGKSQRGECDEVFEDLGTCLRDCICKLDNGNKAGEKNGR